MKALPLLLLVFLATSGLMPIDEELLPAALQEHKGQTILVNFWATWCIPCREEFPDLAQLYRERHKDGLSIISISIDSPENESAAAAFLEEHNTPFPGYIANAEKLRELLKAMDPDWTGAIPATFIFNTQGQEVYSHVGKLSYQEMATQLDKVATN